MTYRAIQRRHRRGMAVSEWFIVLGLLALGLVWWGNSLGTTVSGDLTQTGSDLGDPAALAKRFGNTPTSGGGGSTATTTTGGSSEGSSEDGGSSKPKGNNGVGNGEDGAPPGEPPENDGEGTGPGNPGNKGGAHK